MADLSVKLPKPKYGQVVVLQKNGDEPRGHGFPLISTSCVVGRSTAADIRISSADVSLTHCKFMINEASGEASLEVHGNETEVNGTLIEAVTTIKLNHRDIVLVGGRKLRFEYLPPDYKPLPSKPISVVFSDSFNAEVVDLEENGDVVDSTTEKEEEFFPEVQCTPAGKRVSFGPYLSPEQFDNTLPPATPIKKGATPRRSTRYSGLKFNRPAIDHIVEEDVVLESPAEEPLVTSIKECVDETIISEDPDTSNLVSDETAIVDPSLGIGSEFADLPTASNLEISIDAMSTMSDVSNIAAVPSECCSFLDEPIEEDEFGPEVVEPEEETPIEDSSLFSDDLIGVPVPPMTPHLTNGTELLRSFTTSSLTENIDEDEEGITLSPEDMSEVRRPCDSTIESTTALEEVVQAPVAVETKEIPSDVKSTDTLENVKSVVAELADNSTEDVTKVIEATPAVVVEKVEQIDIEKVLVTPESSPVKMSLKAASPVTNSPEVAKETDQTTQLPQSPKADTLIGVLLPQTPEAVTPQLDTSNLEGVARLLETPKTTRSTAVIGRTTQADYTDVRGVKKQMQTPKADYRDVRGVKRLLATPKAVGTPIADYTDVEGVEQLLKTPKVDTPATDEDVTGLEVTESAEQMIEAERCKTDAPIIVEEEIDATLTSNKPVEQEKPVVEESKSPDTTAEIPVAKEPVSEEESKRGRRAAAVKSDDANVSGVKLPLDTPKTAAEPPKDDDSGVDLLTKTPESKSEKQEVVAEIVAETLVEEDAPLVTLEATELTKVSDEEALESSEKDDVIIPKISDEETKEIEKEDTPPRRGRRVAAKTSNTPKADYSDVSGVKRLLKTPKADVVNVDVVVSDKITEIIVEESAETVEETVTVDVAVTEENKPTEEQAKEVEADVAPRRGRRSTAKTPATPKADYSDVIGVKRLLKTPKADVINVDVDVSDKITEIIVEKSAETIEETVTVDVAVAVTEELTEEQAKEVEADVAPRRGRRSTAKTPATPKADYSDVIGVKRLLKTPKDVPETPQADDTNVEGVDVCDKIIEITVERSAETIEEAVTVNVAVAVHEENETNEEQTKESEIEKDVAPRRGRRTAAKTPTTPKADYRDVSGVKRLLKTPKAAPETPKADYTDVEGVDLLMKTPKGKESEAQIEEEKQEVVHEVVSDDIVEESPPVEALESFKTIETVKPDDSTLVVPPVDEIQPPTLEKPEIEKESTPPRRGRRAAATAKPNTPKADYTNVSGVKRLLKTPKAAPETPKADYCNVEGVDLLMKTPKVNDAEPAVEKIEDVAVEPTEVVENENPVVVAQIDEPAKEEIIEQVAAPRRGRKTVQTPKTDVSEVEMPLETTKVASPQSTVDEIDLTITESDEEVKIVPVEASPVNQSTAKTLTENVDGPKESEVEKEATPPRRGRRATPATKTTTPKPAGRSKRKPSESDSLPELNGTGELPTDQSPVEPPNTPKRSRRGAAPSTKVDTPKAVRSTRSQRPSESDSGQSDQVEGRRSKRRKDEVEKLALSPVVRLRRIDLALGANTSEEVASKAGSSSGEESNAVKEVNAVRRGRGRPAKVPKTVDEEKAPLKTAGRKGKMAVPAVEESIPSDDEEVKSIKKSTTRRAGVKRVCIPEEVVPDGKRRRGETAGAKHVTGLDDVEMLHEGKGHAADIHANHMPDELETKEVSPVTSTKSGRSTRSKSTLKVHFDVAVSAPSPVRATRSARKVATASPVEQQVAVVLERDPDIDTLAASATEEDEKVSTKRSRQKKVAVPDDSPTVPAAKRTRGGKKTTNEPVKEDTPAPPSPRRSRRTRNN